jgi:hypothetical protein
MHPEGIVYDDATFGLAVAYVRRIDANLGGTEMHAPLKAVLDVPPAGRTRQVILLTDGQVTNEPAIVELARLHRGHNRFFTFGIGPAPSQSWCAAWRGRRAGRPSSSPTARTSPRRCCGPSAGWRRRP